MTGNFHDSLNDAKAAVELKPIFLKAIVRGECINRMTSQHVFKGDREVIPISYIAAQSEIENTKYSPVMVELR